MMWEGLEDEELSVDAGSLDYIEVYSMTIQSLRIQTPP